MLKQTSVEPRTLFLKLFTRELILNSKPPEKIKEDKIKHKEEEKEKQEIKKVEAVKESIIKPTEQEKFIPSILPYQPTLKVAKPLTTAIETQAKKIIAPFPATKFTTPISSLPEVEEVNLGKLSMFLIDKEVSEIECPGPEKFVLVRKAGQVNLTKITLTQKEITEVIERFSREARIPLISGVFKASIGNLTITAIISEFVGSRFIIYKASPYSIIEQQARQLRQAQLQGKMLYSRRL